MKARATPGERDTACPAPALRLRRGAGGPLETDPTEQTALATLTALAGAGLSLRAVSRALAARGILARNGRPFAVSTLSVLIHDRRAASGPWRRGRW